MPHLRVTPKGGSVEEEEDLEAVSPAPPASPLNSRKTAQLPPSFTFTATVATPKLSNDKVTLTLDTAGQHTLSWTEPLSIKGAEETLPAGACNLYLFPAVDGKPVSGGVLSILKEVILAAACDEGCPFFDHPDAVGAFPIHAITVANTDDAIAMSGELLEAKPSLLTQVHALHRAGFPLFTGESSLHICCVNKRVDLLNKMIEIASSRLTKEEATKLFKSQAAGVFFDEMPMRFYGGTPLAYACCFDLRDSVERMLRTGFVTFDDRSDACCITGFLPVHAVCANGLMETYDWMTTQLPEELRATVTERSSVGRQVSLNVHGLWPVQLAAQLGDHASVKHILRKQCSILWIWGPVTQHSMNLLGIDSAGDGGGDIMELVARNDAKRDTCALLLDSFMCGFIHKLFLLKWKSFGYKLHYGRLFLDGVVLMLLIGMAFVLKETPERQNDIKPLAVVLLALMVILVEEELRTTYLWWKNNEGEGDSKIAFKTMLREAITFMRMHNVIVLFWSYLFTTVSCITVLTCSIATLPSGYVDASGSLGRRLKGGEVMASTSSATAGMYLVGDTDLAPGLLWFTLSMAIFLMMPYFAFTSFTPFEKLNIFMLSVVKMLKRDLMVFLILFCFFMADFYFTLYILYPRSGSVYLPQVLPFNRARNGIRSLFELAFTGSPSVIDLDADFSLFSTFQLVDFFIWLVVYLFFIILSLILLLNLLIAMLSFTFEMVREESTLQCRTSFAQRLMRLELLAESFGMSINVGEHKGGNDYTFDFRSVEGSDGAAEGGDDPFALPDGGPLARIEDKLLKLEEKLAAKKANAVVETEVEPM